MHNVLECFPDEMYIIPDSFGDMRTVVSKLVCRLIVLIILFIIFAIILILTYNYLDSNYYYWAPAFSIVVISLLLILIIYEIGRIHYARVFVNKRHEYKRETAGIICGWYQELNIINSNFIFKDENVDQEPETKQENPENKI